MCVDVVLVVIYECGNVCVVMDGVCYVFFVSVLGLWRVQMGFCFGVLGCVLYVV